MTVTRGLPARALAPWTARATSSLPVPDSPVMSTVASVGATVAMISRMALMAGLRPRISGPAAASLSWRRSSRFSTLMREWSTARCRVSRRASKSSGLVR